VCGSCEYENGEYRRRYCADGSGVDASGGRCGHGAHGTVQAFPRGEMLVIPARTSSDCTGTIWSFRDDACEAGRLEGSNASFRSRATALRKYPSHPAPTLANPGDCRASPARRLRVLDRNSVVPKPAWATPAMISKAWACLRTSIFFRQSDARTNIRADLTASPHCIFASPAQSVSRSTRALRCRRRKRLTGSVSSFSTSCSEIACDIQVETRHSR